MTGEQTADGVFALLSNEIRVDVLRAVAHAQREEAKTGVPKLSFSEIYDRIDVDNTSKLSYHLGELTGTFLRKREGGYVFTHAGEQLVRFVLAENFRRPTDVGTIEATGSCLFCGESDLRATLEDQYFMIRCSDCGRPAFSYRVTPAQVRSHAAGDLIDAVARELAGDFLKMRRGICPDCAGRLDTDVIEAGAGPGADEVPASFATFSECRECLRCLSVPLTHAAVYHPESISFHWEHGVDVLGTGVWEFHRHLHADRWTSERVDDDPDEYRVEFRREDASLRLYLDGNARVTRTERVRRRNHDDTRK